MKPLRVLFMALAAIVILITISGCSSDVELGNWDAMKWKYSSKLAQSKEVPVEGADFEITCTNYGLFWIHQVNDRYLETPEGWKGCDIEGVCQVSLKHNVMHVIIEPNTTDSTRTITIDVSAGDVFDYFKWAQPSK